MTKHILDFVKTNLFAFVISFAPLKFLAVKMRRCNGARYNGALYEGVRCNGAFCKENCVAVMFVQW